MKIRDLDLDQYVIVYDIGKSEYSEGMTVVGRVEEIVFNDDNDNVATINSLGNLYDITDDNYFDLWSNYIEGKTERMSDNKKPSVCWSLIWKDTLVTDEGKYIKIPESIMEDPMTDILSYVDKQINKTKQSVEARVKAINKNIEDSQKYIDEVKSNDLQQRKRNDTVNHPSHYNYGEIEVIDYCDQVCKTYPPELAPYVFNAIKYLSRANYKNGQEDIDKAKYFVQRLFDKWE